MPVIHLTVSRRDLKKVQRRLQSPGKFLERLGKAAAKESKDAFTAQRFNGQTWPERYPRQPAPFINIAGALSDLNQGRFPKNNRFQRRPVLKDSGFLAKSTRVKSFGQNGIQVENAASYADDHADGKRTRQTVSWIAKMTLGLLLKKSRKYLQKNRNTPGGLVNTAKNRAILKLGFLMRKSELVTWVHKRPFIGWTQTLQKTAAIEGKKWLTRG